MAGVTKNDKATQYKKWRKQQKKAFKKEQRHHKRQEEGKAFKLRSGKVYAVIGALLFAILAGVSSYYGLFSSLDYMLSDKIFQLLNQNEEDSKVKIIAIDEQTVKQFGKYETWSRSVTANLIEELNSEENHRPAAIGLSLDLSEERTDGGDEKLVNVCKKYENVCVSAVRKGADGKEDMEPLEKPDEKPDAAPSASAETGTPEDIQKRGGLELPYEKLRSVVNIGITNIANSMDGVARESMINTKVDGTQYDSFAITVYKNYLKSSGETYIQPATNDNKNFSFQYYRDSSDYDVYSFYDVRVGYVNPGQFKDAIVLVADYTDNSIRKGPGKKLRSIEVQANIIDALVERRTGQSVSKLVVATLYGLFIALFFFVTAYSTSSNFVLEALVLIIALLLTCGILYVLGYYLSILIPLLFLVIITVVNLAVRYGMLRRNRHQMENVLKKYVDENIVNGIVSEGEIAVKIGGLRKDIAVLFVDIRGFTSLSESMQPEEIVDILNHYLSLVSEAVVKNQGTLDKFIGDAAMAVFNSPFDLTDYEYHAACAAWDIRESAKKLNETCRDVYGKEVNFGIGIHCGEAVIGNIGCEIRMDYTAIGDTVNTASRLEGSAAPGQILISKAMKERLGERVTASYVGEYSFKGKKNKMPVYSIDAIVREEEEEPETVEGNILIRPRT